MEVLALGGRGSHCLSASFGAMAAISSAEETAVLQKMFVGTHGTVTFFPPFLHRDVGQRNGRKSTECGGK